MATTQLLDKIINIDDKEYSITAVKADEAAKLTNGLKINIGDQEVSFDGSNSETITIPQAVQADWNIDDDSSDAFIKNKPDVIVEGDSRLTDARTPKAHNQAATTITEDTTHRFVTDAEKATWNAKSNFSGNYDDLNNKPTVNNGTLTIQRNGATVQTFTANSASNVTANIVVPTKTSDLTNDSGFKTTDANQTVKTGSVTFGANDVVEFVAGSNVTITGNATNKTITINSTGGGTGNGDMLKSVYDTNNNGKVDTAENAENAEKLGGVAASNYAKKSDIHNITVSQDEPTGGATGDIWFKY